MLVPSEDDIASVIGILGLDERDRSVVSAALQTKNNDIGTVVNEYFDDPVKFKQQYSWDDSVFSGDRAGTTHDQVPSFSIHPADDSTVIQGVDPSFYGPGAPSRPPSRANSRSPLSKIVEFTANDADLPSTADQEDADLQRAIAESVAENPQQQAQESGIMQGHGGQPYFGPANRTDYDQDQWAMITLNREMTEPEPWQRMRNQGQPAFLRCRKDQVWEKHRLGAILTIFHAIPAARNVLLRSGTPPPQGYGSNSQWWKGEPILQHGVPGDQDAGQLNWATDSVGWSEELHRLTAFLDSTTRSYGTADLLAEARPEDGLASGDREKDFFEHIRSELGNEEKIAPLIATAEVVSISGDEPSFTNTWSLLEPPFPKEQLMMADNLYNIWDMIFFMDPSSERRAMITEPAEVMTIRFSGDDGFPKHIEIPQTFYIDRYLAEHQEEMAQLQIQMSALAQATATAHKAEEMLTKLFEPQSERAFSRVAANKKAIRQCKQTLSKLKSGALWRKHEEMAGVVDEAHYLSADEETDEADQTVEYTEDEVAIKDALEAEVEFHIARIRDIESKLHKLSAERQACEEVFRKLGSSLTIPSEEQKWHPTHKYTLRGVANDIDTFFVCVRAQPDLMEIDESKEARELVDQWWKVAYNAEDEQSNTVTECTWEKVVEEALGIGSKPILIYASEKAMAEEPLLLSDALQTFVRFDNRFFRQELKESAQPSSPSRDAAAPKKRGPFMSPASPSKRLARSASIDSMATNQASAGSSDAAGPDDDDMRDAPFESDYDHHHFRDALVDTSVPPPPPRQQQQQLAYAYPQAYPTPPDTHDAAEQGEEPPAMGRQSARLANVSLEEMAGVSAAPVEDAAAGGAEMQERQGTSPFLVQQSMFGNAKDGGLGGKVRGVNLTEMELDEELEG